MSLYLPILKTAWRTAVRERRLWGFALFAGLLIGSGFGTAVVQVTGVDPTRSVLPSILDLNVGSLSRIGPLWSQAVATGTGAVAALSALGVVILALLLAILWFAVVGANALVLAGEHVARAKAIPRDLRQRAQARFWPTFTIHLIAKVVTIALITAWGSVLTTTAFAATPRATVRGIIAFVVTATILTVIHIATPYAIASATLDRRGALSAIREALVLLRDRWLISVEASLLLTTANFLSIAAWAAGSLVLALPFLFLGGIAIANGASAMLTVAIIAGIAVLVAYLVLIAMVFTTFLTMAWTLLYLRLTSEGEEPEAWTTRVVARRGKSEARNSKFETNPNDRMTKF